MWTLIKSSIFWAFLFLITLILGIWFYTQNRNLHTLLSTKIEELQKADLALGRANTKIADANIMISKINKDLQEEIKKRNGLLSLYAELEGKYEAEKKKVKTLTKIVYVDKYIEHVIDIPEGQIFYKDKDNQYKPITSMRWNYSDFRIDIQGDAIKQEIAYKLHQRFRGQFIESTLPNGVQNHYFKLYELDEKGNDVGELNLTKFDVIKSSTIKDHMMWWSPRLDLAIGTGVTQSKTFGWNADLGLSLSSYGKIEHDLLFRFFRFSFGFSTDGVTLGFTPIQYNLGRPLPLLTNLWIGPFAAFNIQTKQGLYGMNIGVMF